MSTSYDSLSLDSSLECRDNVYEDSPEESLKSPTNYIGMIIVMLINFGVNYGVG
jgi:hypothetical protein